MAEDDLLDEFWDSALDADEIDHDAFLAQGGKEIDRAVNVHRLLRKAASNWRKPDPPKFFGKFEVIGDLGAGGLGRVYLCWDPELRREVAVKVIARDHWAINEARSIARLDHRAIVKVYDVGHDRIVMELLDGGTLADRIRELSDGEESPLDDLRARLHCLARLAEGLAYCHEHGILHRDVKPANVMFARGDEHPRLVDFGLAHIDDGISLDITQNLVGTPAYLAPEQVESNETGSDARSDIFSFGVLAQELLTLRSPFACDTRTATLEAIQRGRPQRLRELIPNVPKPVEDIVEHCLELDPNDRYQAMQEVARDLHDAIANRPISIAGRSVTHRTKLFFKRNKRVTLIALSGAIATLSLSLGAWLNALRVERAQFEGEVHLLAERVEQIAEPYRFRETGLQLNTAQVRAGGLDDSWVGAGFFGSFSPRVQHVVERWSTRLGEAIRADADFEKGRFPDEEWKGLLQIDQYIHPAGTHNEDLKERGRVLLSDELLQRGDVVVLRQVVRGEGWWSAYRDYRPVQLNMYPQKGQYRFVIEDIWSRELLVDSVWAPQVVIELVPRKLSTEGWFEDPDGRFIASPPISVEQATALFVEATGTSPVFQAPLPTDACRCNWLQAQAMVTWAGGRLPIGQEVGAILEVQGVPDEPGIRGEWISDIRPTGGVEDCTTVGYQEWLDDPEGAPAAWQSNEHDRESPTWILSNDPRTGGRIGFGFRVIYDRGNPLDLDNLKPSRGQPK